MNGSNVRMGAAWLPLGVLALWAAVSTEARAQAPAVDPEAVKVLRRMTDYLGGLKQFSVHTHNNFEDVLDSGERVDYDTTGSVTVSRPNKVRGERHGEQLDQVIYYDGKTLALHNPSQKVYAKQAVAGTIEEMFDFARESLGIGVAVSDLIYRNGFPLLMQDVTSARVVGKTVIRGVRCDHVLFSRPGVDFQLWVADAGPPLPRKYVVTDRGTPALLSVTTVMTDWNEAPTVTDAQFTFAPPQGAKAITFLRLGTSGGAVR